MSLHNILIVEDEKSLGTTLFEYLEEQDYQCQYASCAKEALDLFQKKIFTVVLMDINLPDGNGVELAKKMKSLKENFVLIFLSAQNDPETKFEGLDMGADDYMTKPFDLRELRLRLNKALSTHDQLTSRLSSVKLGALEIFFKDYYVLDASKSKISLKQKECAILDLLYSKLNQVVSRDEIIENVWGEDSFPTNRTVDNYIVKLRRWIETDPSKTIAINSVRGVGYQLEKKES